MIDVLASLLTSISANPWLVSALIILATFILEDATTVAVGMLAVGGVVSPPVAIASLFFGIVAGDAGLYAIGRAAKKIRVRPGLLSGRKIVIGRRWLRRRLLPALLGARFTPGLRLPTFFASGFLRISFWRFFAIVTGSAALWTAAVFTLIWFFGPMVIALLGAKAWLIAIAVAAIAFTSSLWLRRPRAQTAGTPPAR